MKAIIWGQSLQSNKRNTKVHKKATSRDQPDVIEQVVHLRQKHEYCDTYDLYVSVSSF